MKQDIVRYPACFYSMLHNRFACRDDAFRWSTVNRRLLVLSGWANACVDLNLRPRALAYLSRAAPSILLTLFRIHRCVVRLFFFCPLWWVEARLKSDPVSAQ